MNKEELEQLKSTVKQWLFHTGSLDPTNYANELKVKFIEPREKRIAELEDKLANAYYQLEGRDIKIKELEQQIEKMKCLLNEIYSEFGFSELVKIRNDLPIEIQEVIKEIKEK